MISDRPEKVQENVLSCKANNCVACINALSVYNY